MEKNQMDNNRMNKDRSMDQTDKNQIRKSKTKDRSDVEFADDKLGENSGESCANNCNK